MHHLSFLWMSASFGLFVWACAPPVPAEPPAAVEETAPPEPGVIPWAEGERPVDAAATTREVGEQPGSSDDSIVVSHPDEGIVSSQGGPACKGRATPALRADVQVRASELKQCGAHLSGEGGGTLTFSLKVEADGQVGSVTLLSDSLGEAAVETCVQERLSQSFDVAPSGGCAIFVIPVEFSVNPASESRSD